MLLIVQHYITKDSIFSNKLSPLTMICPTEGVRLALLVIVSSGLHSTRITAMVGLCQSKQPISLE